MYVCLLFFGLTWGVMAQAVAVNAKPLIFPGLLITQATNPNVQASVPSLRVNAIEIQQLLPYSFILENYTGRTIVAYTLHLTFVDAQGNSGGHNRQYFNFESKTNGLEIAPGAIYLVTPIASIPAASLANLQSNYSSNAELQDTTLLLRRLESQVSVAASIDLVVFEDGQVIGPDEANTLAYLRGYLIGGRETASLIRSALNKSVSMEDLSSQLRSLSASLGQRSSFEDLARASQARRYLGLARFSKDDLAKEVDRVLAARPLVLHR